MRAGTGARQGALWRQAAALLAIVVITSGCWVSGTWTPQPVESTAPDIPDRVVLADVDCPATGACVATGHRETMSGAPLTTVVLRQSDIGWTSLDVPNDTVVGRAVSCRAVDDCLVAGSPLDLHVSATGVELVPVDAVASSTPPALDCVAEGCLRVRQGGAWWWDGTVLSPVAAPPPQLQTNHQSVSCASATSCLLVATQPDGNWNLPLARTVSSAVWDGSGWSAVSTVRHQTRVHDVDCPSPTSCFAAAGIASWLRSIYGGPRPEILAWDGAAWSTADLGPSGPTLTEPGRISCASPTSCRAVLTSGATSAPYDRLASWDGSTWTVSTSTSIPALTALDCSSPSTCVAVGADAAATFDGSVWTAMAVPGGASPGDRFRSVSCTAPHSCMATGLTSPSNDPIIGLLDGSTWSSQPVPSRQDHVECGGPTSCMTATVDFGSRQLRSRHWDGTIWTDLPVVQDTRVQWLGDLSCPASNWCLLSTYATASSTPHNVAWVWDGTAGWTELGALPDTPAGGASVSCDAPGSCVAVAENWAVAVYRLSGGTWSPMTRDGLEGADIAEVADLDCPSAATCVLGGRRYSSGGAVAVLRDGTWHVTYRTGRIGSVSCWADDGCAALEGAEKVAALDGLTWRNVRGLPGLATLDDISCAGVRTCEVVGAFVDGADRSIAARLDIDE